jgi:hypothetical protein
MRLPHLDQLIDLHRGEAAQLLGAIAAVAPVRSRPVAAPLLLALPVLGRLGKRLQALDQRERRVVGPPPRRPRRFRLRHDEVIALMLYVFPAPGIVARVPLGRVQQVSLSLARWIDFAAEPA